MTFNQSNQFTVPSEPTRAVYDEITVVIPLYNKGSHITQTIMSVIAQSHSHWKLIIVNDGSTDDSYARAKSVKDKRIRVINQKNQGVCSARNRGVQEADTSYVAFLDADDQWYPWHLEELTTLIRTFPGLGIYSTAHNIRRNGICYSPLQPYDRGFRGQVEEPMGAFSTSLSLVHSSTACLNRQRLIKDGGFPIGIKKGEDVYVWLRTAMSYGLAYSTRFCAEYNQDSEHRCSINHNPDIPYYLKWLDEKVQRGEFDGTQKKGVHRLLSRGIFFNAAGFKISGNKVAFKRLMQLKFSQTPNLFFKLLLLQITPQKILTWAQKYRHHASERPVK